jgi:hypothetical protein
MEYRPLGRTGVHVSKLCLGTMMFGAWGNTDHDDSIRIIHRALDAGVNFVDSADVYSAGESEEIVGKALKGRRDDVVLATKFYMPMGEDPNRRGVSRRWIITEVENSTSTVPSQPGGGAGHPSCSGTGAVLPHRSQTTSSSGGVAFVSLIEPPSVGRAPAASPARGRLSGRRGR